MHSADEHRIPERHAVATLPAMCAEPAGLACAYMQSLRVHFDPSLQSVLGFLVLYLQAEHEPQLTNGMSSCFVAVSEPSSTSELCPAVAASDRGDAAAVGATQSTVDAGLCTALGPHKSFNAVGKVAWMLHMH